MPVPPESAPSTYGCLSTIAIAGLIVAPIYLLLRYFVKLIRYRYGFAELPEDTGPPLRICEGCHNTVLEVDFQHCPYCGRPLPPLEPGPDQPPAAAQHPEASHGVEPSDHE